MFYMLEFIYLKNVTFEVTNLVNIFIDKIVY